MDIVFGAAKPVAYFYRMDFVYGAPQPVATAWEASLATVDNFSRRGLCVSYASGSLMIHTMLPCASITTHVAQW